MIKKRLTQFVIIIYVTLIIITLPVSAYGIIGLSNFVQTQIYTDGIFTDVSNTAWYADNVKTVYNYGLMNGVDSGKFNPQGAITIAETITIAARVHCSYYVGENISIDSNADFPVWYEPYLIYCTDAIIINKDYPDYNAPITRAEFAKIISGSVDPIDLEEINTIDDGAIPDVPSDTEYADGVYLLYRAGVLTGADSNGSFNPDATITRAEAAAVITRIIDPSLRQSLDLGGEY